MHDHAETRLQIAIVNYLRGEIRHGKSVIKVQKPFDVLFLHPVNEFKHETEAFWAKAKGIYPGAADLLFWWLNGFGAIELKTATGRQSPNQRTFESYLVDFGGRYAVCRTVAEVRDTLKSWGLACKNEQALEPKLSHAELLAMQEEANRP